MAVYVFKVNGSTKTLQPGWGIRESPNGRNLFDGHMLSLDGSFRLEVGDAITLTEDAVLIFGGTIDQPSEAGFGGQTSTNAIDLRVSAVDFNEIADRREVVLDIVAGNTKAALTALAPYYTDYGVTLDVAQANGPALPALSFNGEQLREVLDQISALTDHEWSWTISYAKVLGAYEIAATPTPFDVEDADADDHVDGDITVEQPTASNYANYIVLLAGTGAHTIDFERHNGNGVTRTFVLDVPVLGLIGALRIDGGPGGFPVGVYGVDVMQWTFDAATNAIIQDPAYTVIAVGHYIEMSYTGSYPLRVTADGGALPADRVDKTYTAETVFDRTVAQALADAYLVRDMRRPRTVKYSSFDIGIHPGQTQLFDIAKRDLSGQFVITDVEIRNTSGQRVRRFVTAVEGEILPASIGETVMSWGGAGGGSAAAASVTIVTSGGVGGSGTSGKIAKWATSATLTDSLLTEAGSVVTVAGTLAATTLSGATYSGTTTATGPWTFTSAPAISSTEPALYFNETDQGSNLKLIRFDLQGGVLQVQTLSDAFSVLATIFTLSRAGALAVSSGITAGSGGVGIVDSTGKIPAISSTYFASLSGVNLTGVDLLGSVNTHTVTGLHTWTGGVNGNQRLVAVNTTSNTAAMAGFRADAGSTIMVLDAFSQGYTTSGAAIAASVKLEGTGAGGVTIIASGAAGDARIYSRNALAATFGASQALALTGAADVAGNFSVATNKLTVAAASGNTVVAGTLNVTGVTTHTADIVPTTAYTVNLGALTNKLLAVHAAELWVQTITQANVTAVSGGRWVIPKNTAALAADLTAIATTISLNNNGFANGDRVWLEGNGKLEFIAIASAVSGSGPYTYTITRNLDGSGANAWSAGDAVINTGTTGDGFIDAYASTGILAGSGPSIAFMARTGTTYSQIVPRVVVGNLNGTYGYVATTYGMAAGDAGATNVTVDATNGFRIRNSTTTKFQADISGNLSIVGDLSVGTAGVIRSNATAFGTGTGYWLAYNAGTPQFRVGTTAGNRLSWDGTDFVLQSASVVIDSVGVTLGTGAAITVYTSASALKFSRVTGLGFGQTGDHYGLYPVPTAGGGNGMYLENTVIGNTTTDSDASVSIIAAGWDKDGGGVALDDVRILLASTSILSSVIIDGGALFQTTATLVQLVGDVDLYSGRFRTGKDVDTTTYTQSNKNLLAGNVGEALGIAGSTSLANINFYLQGVAQRKATIQAVGGVGAGSNGGRLLIFTKDDTASGTDVVQAGYFDFSTASAGGGFVMGAPTGGSKGAGTINCKAAYDDNVLLTDWVFDIWATGTTTIPHAGRLYSMADVETIARDERRLPWMPNAQNFESRRSLGELVTNLWQGAEQTMIYVMDHETRIAALEGSRSRA